jgi:YD repeat-containing protein
VLKITDDPIPRHISRKGARTNAVGDVAYFTYDAQGRLTSSKSFNGLTTTNIYPATGFVNFPQTQIDLEIGRTNSFAYVNDLVSTRTDERGVTTTYTHDGLQRVLTASDPRGTNSYTYSKLDLVQTVDRMGFTNSFGYDALRRMTNRTNALGFYTLYNYCSCGSLDSIRDAGGNYTYFSYDNAGRRTQVSYPDSYTGVEIVDPRMQIFATRATQKPGEYPKSRYHPTARKTALREHCFHGVLLAQHQSERPPPGTQA